MYMYYNYISSEGNPDRLFPKAPPPAQQHVEKASSDLKSMICFGCLYRLVKNRLLFDTGLFFNPAGGKVS